MSKKSIRILSIIALVFIGIFSVALVAFFSVVSFGNESDVSTATVVIGIILAASGIPGIVLFFAVKFFNREPKIIVAPPEEPEGGGEGEASESGNSAEFKPE
ncbi:MAG: hypothetical protein FWD58_05330 [Firmicutes bacterium]|nr:hypothetical protein [Bacillota bacterium]